MFVPSQDTPLSLDCKVSLQNPHNNQAKRDSHGEHRYTVAGWPGRLNSNSPRRSMPMSWIKSKRPEPGVLAVATYAENAKKTAENTPTFHTIS